MDAQAESYAERVVEFHVVDNTGGRFQRKSRHKRGAISKSRDRQEASIITAKARN
jgi:hypothetical protein